MSEIFWQFLKLGCLSFGGPAAHIGYFRKRFVDELSWVNDEQYAQFVAMSQFLPGPGSSQIGFAIGLHRLGIKGALAAFIGFTLPSFVIMVGFALTLLNLSQSQYFIGLMHGLKLLSVVVVADACLVMAKNFCQQWPARLITVSVALVLMINPDLWLQMLALVMAAIIGALSLNSHGHRPTDDPNSLTLIQVALMVLFIVLLVLSFLPADMLPSSLTSFLNFYQAGSLVFGGGHVVLPFLQNSTEGLVPPETFLSGYALAQAIPGPMFTFASYLGAQMSKDWPWMNALSTTLAVFLPGFILVYVLKNQLHKLSALPRAGGALMGINASVVGLLLAALYSPVWMNSVTSILDTAWVCGGLLILRWHKLPVHWMVLGFALISTLCY